MRGITTAILLLFVLSVNSAEMFFLGGSGHDEYLGCISCSESDANAICNSHGSFGNEFSGKGMFNAFAGFGNEFDSASPWNEFSTSSSVPILVDQDNKFYGYFTINTSRSDAVDFSGVMRKIYYERYYFSWR